MHSFGERLQTTFREFGQLCVGIDPSIEQLSKWGLGLDEQGLRTFSLEILDAARGAVGIVKPQVAFFEQFGSKGFQVLEEVLEVANSYGLLVIADAKRGDIGSTMSGYAHAWLANNGPFIADALTVSPFLGADSLAETVEIALKNDKGVFVLAATSNSESKPVQSASWKNSTVASGVVEFVSSYKEVQPTSIGVVIGANVALNDFGIDESQLMGVPILMPGFGAQGTGLDSVRERFGALSNQLICNVSRSIAGESKDGINARVQKAQAELELGLEI